MHPQHQPRGTLVNVTHPLPTLEGAGPLWTCALKTRDRALKHAHRWANPQNPQSPRTAEAKGSLQGSPAKPFLLQ